MPKKSQIFNTDDPTSDDDSQAQSMLGDDSTTDDTTDATAGSTQSQMSAGELTIKKKKTNPHAYTVKWS